MVTREKAGVKVGTFAFPKGWVRRYPVGMDLGEKDHLAVGSGLWDRAQAAEDDNAVRRVAGQWVEDLEGVSFADVDVDYLDFVVGRGGMVAGLIAAWKKTPEGREAFSDRVWTTREVGWMYRTWGSLQAHKNKRASESGSGDRFIPGGSESGFIPGVDDTPDDGWYSGARWLQAGRPAPDFDPSPWTVTGMVARSRGDLKFKGANLLPVEGRGGPELDWEPAPWQAHAFLAYMRATGRKGWLTVRKSGRDVEFGALPVAEVPAVYDAGGDFPVRPGQKATTTPSVRASWKAAVECLVERTGRVPAGFARAVVTDLTPARACVGTTTKVVTARLFVPTRECPSLEFDRVQKQTEKLGLEDVVSYRGEPAFVEVRVAEAVPVYEEATDVRIGYRLDPVYKPRSYDAVVELPGEWLPNPRHEYRLTIDTGTGQQEVTYTTTADAPTFLNRHKWDAVLVAATTLRSLYQAMTERGLGAIPGEPHTGGTFEWQNDLAKSLGTAPAADPRQSICSYAADVYASMPTEKECEPALARVREAVGRLTDLVGEKAARMADEAAKPRARDKVGAMAGWLGAFRKAVESRLGIEYAGDEAVGLFEEDRRAQCERKLKLKAFLAYEKATAHRRKFEVTGVQTREYACVEPLYRERDEDLVNVPVVGQTPKAAVYPPRR